MSLYRATWHCATGCESTQLALLIMQADAHPQHCHACTLYFVIRICLLAGLGDCWRLLETVGDCWRLLETVGEPWRTLEKALGWGGDEREMPVKDVGFCKHKTSDLPNKSFHFEVDLRNKDSLFVERARGDNKRP
ncbi:hypothetical protein ACMFMF_000058 [Clarireedia jacksonii]